MSKWNLNKEYTVDSFNTGEETRAENLINRGANVNEVDGRGRTALHLAAQDG